MDTHSESVERITFYNPENGYTELRLRPEHQKGIDAISKSSLSFDGQSLTINERSSRSTSAKSMGGIYLPMKDEYSALIRGLIHWESSVGLSVSAFDRLIATY